MIVGLGYYRIRILAATPPHHVIQAITSEGLAQGPYVAARGVFEPATFLTEGTHHHHSTYHAPNLACFGRPRQQWMHELN